MCGIFSNTGFVLFCFFAFLCPFFFFDGFKRIFKYSAEGLSSALHHKKAAMCLMEKIRGLDKLHSGTRIVLLAEFNVNKSTIYIQ